MVSGAFVIVQPLLSPTVKVVISNVPPFIPDEDIQRELLRYGKFASGIKMVPLGCKHEPLKHVLSFRRQVFMFLNAPTLNVSFRCVYEGKSYMLYVNTGEMCCFECGAVGHVRLSCPQREEVMNETGQSKDTNGSVEQTVEERVENEDQNVHNNKDLGSVGAERETNTTEVSKVVENVNGETQVIEEMVMTETERNTEQVEKVEGVEEVMSVDRDQLSNRRIVNSEGKNAEEMVENEGEGESDDDLSDVSDVSNLSQIGCDQFYALEEIDAFLDETSRKVAEVKDYLTDTKKFESSVLYWMKRVGEDKLSRRKRF